MTKSGKLKSYWSYVSNVHNKISGTQEGKAETRKAIKKLTGIKLKTFPTLAETRKIVKKWNTIKKKKAKEYQKEVFKTTNKKIKLKDAIELMPDFDIDGSSSVDFPTGES